MKLHNHYISKYFHKPSQSFFINLFCTLAVLILFIYAVPSLAITSVEIYKSPTDSRKYEGLYLDNGLKVLLISDPLAQKAAAAINVQVGSYNDPDERAGLAHFLEHMLFLGTKKYPIADEYSQFLAAHGGDSNAFTSNRNTQYYFTVLPEHLPGALDRFAQFFIEPLFTTEFVERERNAVDSEYKLNIDQDNYRSYAVFKTTANPEHPISRFSVGSLETLADRPNSVVRDELIKFYQDYYSADRMALVVIGPQPLEELKELVLKDFSSVPRHAVKSNETIELVYTKSELQKIVKMQTLSDVKTLNLSFSIPNQKDNYLQKPDLYIENLLLRTAKGSLYAKLRDKNWIIGMDAAAVSLSYNQDLFQIMFDLTNDGLKHTDEIIQYTMAYLDYLREIGPQEKIFAQLKSAAERELKYIERSDPSQMVMDLPMNMQYYPLQDVLIADGLSEKSQYDKLLIMDLLSYLRSDNMKIMITAPDIKGNKVEPYYNVSYSEQKFSENQNVAWNKKLKESNFALVLDNQFMPENFKVINSFNPFGGHDIPREIISTPGNRVWYKLDSNFKLPKQQMVILFAAPNMAETPQRYLMQLIMTEAIRENLIEYADRLQLAGVSVNLQSNPQGLVFSVGMYSDKQERVLELIKHNLCKLNLTADKFKLYKQRIKRDMQNFYHAALYSQGIQALRAVINQPAWLPSETLPVIDKITMADCIQYHKSFMQNIQIRCLIQGNVAADTVIDDMQKFADSLPVFNKQLNIVYEPELLQISPGKTYAYNLKTKRNDAANIFYYQSPQSGLREVGISMLLADIVGASFYNQLRTVEQLGYVVAFNPAISKERAGLISIIESPVANAQLIAEREKDFITKYRENLVTITGDELNRYKSSVSDLLTKKPVSLAEETANNWNAIIDGRFDFEYKQKVAKHVRNLELTDLLLFYDETLLHSDSTRRVAITVSKDGLKDFGTKIDNLTVFKEEQVYK